MTLPRRTVLALSLVLFVQSGMAAPAAAPYFPPPSEWARKSPAELGMDPAALAAAVSFAQLRETERARDFSDQETTFGERLGSMPTKRAATNGVVIYKGFVVATVAGVAVREGASPASTTGD